jgi:hypothetical protein
MEVNSFSRWLEDANGFHVAFGKDKLKKARF